MKTLHLDLSKAKSFLKEGEYEAYAPKAMAALKAVEDGTRVGNDFLGWVSLPSSITADFLHDIKETANVLRANCQVIVVAGIGGSYLGSVP